jgi:uncharacterized NAD-dependent epimerase/dehydratase family protein
MRRLLITTEGKADVEAAKTATGLLHFAADQVVGLIDSAEAGRTVQEAFGVSHPAPIFSSVQEAIRQGLAPTHLILGLATPGGDLPAGLRTAVLDALEHGLEVVSGLHQPLNDDAELRMAAELHGVEIHDVRQPPSRIPVGSMRVLSWPVRRLLTVGTDCNVGKMTTSLLLVEELKRRRHRAVFVPTGQTGIMIAGWGIALDRVISDFATGAGEHLIERVKNEEIAVVEGQGGILHPGFSAVTLGLMHGVLPEMMIMCHKAGRERFRHTSVTIPSPRQMIELHEALLAPLSPGRVIGCSLNTVALTETEALAQMDYWRQETGLPVVDVFRTGPGELADAVEDALQSGKRAPC